MKFGIQPVNETAAASARFKECIERKFLLEDQRAELRAALNRPAAVARFGEMELRARIKATNRAIAAARSAARLADDDLNRLLRGHSKFI